MDTPELKDRYTRNFNTISKDEQHTLGQSRVVVIGLGGLGGGVCEMLARIGVNHLTVVDGDVFEASNLNRQLLSTEDASTNMHRHLNMSALLIYVEMRRSLRFFIVMNDLSNLMF